MNMPSAWPNPPGLKQDEIEKCALCGKGMMHSGHPLFYRVKLTTYCVDSKSIKRQHGLEMSMGEAAPLARIMGPNEDMATPTGDEDDFLVCADCFLDPSTRVAQLIREDKG